MKIAFLIAAAVAALPALEVHPQIGLDTGSTPFTDLRLAVAAASPVTAADVGGRSYDCDVAYGPHIALQWVHGKADQDYGWALGLELTYDNHRGAVSTAVGVQPGFSTEDPVLHSATIVAAPKLVLRPSFGDFVDWGPGSVQLEIGPTLGAGLGWASIGGSNVSTPTRVVSWGARCDLIFTASTQTQFGLSLGYEGFDCTPEVGGIKDASISGNGLTAGLIIGTRL